MKIWKCNYTIAYLFQVIAKKNASEYKELKTETKIWRSESPHELKKTIVVEVNLDELL